MRTENPDLPKICVDDFVEPTARDADSLLAQGKRLISSGNSSEAISIFKKLLDSAPGNYEAILILTGLYLDSDLVHKAAETIALGLEHFPLDTMVLNVSAKVMVKAGMYLDAFKCIKLVLNKESENRLALRILAEIYLAMKEWGNAIDVLLRLHEKNPDDIFTLIGLGIAHLRLSNYEHAREKLEQVLEKQPDNVVVLINLGVALRCLRFYQQAENVLKKALDLNPENSKILAALSTLYIDWHKMDQGLVYANLAIKSAYGEPEILVACAYAQMKCANFEKALDLYSRTLEIEPENHEAALGKASIFLINGQLKEGWEYYAHRHSLMNSFPDGSWPVWNGEGVNGKKIFVRSEQGIGDTIQFCRFLPLLKKIGVKKIIFECSPKLLRLMKCFENIAAICASGTLSLKEKDVDYQIALMDLPRLFDINSITDIPSNCPYIYIKSNEKSEWRKRLFNCKRLKVGLVWAGNPRHADDHNRSIPAKAFSSLSSLKDDIQFYSLQVGQSSKEHSYLRKELGIIDLSHWLHDFAETALALEELDILITIDTASAHLAGALAVKTFILLPFIPDWRWLMTRQDSPWYPSIKLFRQNQPGHWKQVIGKIKLELIKELKN